MAPPRKKSKAHKPSRKQALSHCYWSREVSYHSHSSYIFRAVSIGSSDWPVCREIILHSSIFLSSIIGRCLTPRSQIVFYQHDYDRRWRHSYSVLYSRNSLWINLKHLCQILKLSNEGDHCYLTTQDNLPGRTEKEVIMLSPTLDESQYLYSFETQLPCYFKVVYREHCRS